MRLLKRGAAGAVAVILAASCAGGQPQASRSPATKPTPTASPASFDPPTTFSMAGGPELSKTQVVENAVALIDQVALGVSSAGLTAVDTTTGRIAATVKPKHKVLGEATSFQPPVLVGRGRNQLAVGTLPVTIPGEGTTAPKFAAALIGLNLSTFDEEFNTYVEVATATAGNSQPPSITMVGIADGILVLSSRGSGAMATYGVDLSGPRVLWTAEGFAGGSIAGGTVIGVADAGTAVKESLAGRRLSDGKQLWRHDELFDVVVAPAGPRFGLVGSRDYASGAFSLRMLDKDGNPALQVAAPQGRYGCSFDEAATVVCAGNVARPYPYLFAVDAESGQLLWDLKDEAGERIAPSVSLAWHGAVYGSTKENGPVVLDARTGRDRNSKPGITPIAVSDRCGMAKKEGEELRCFPATG